MMYISEPTMFDKEIYIERLAANLVALRKMLGLTQLELSKRIGISRYKLICYEKGERKITWTSYLAFIAVFLQFEETDLMLSALGIFNNEVRGFLASK